MKIETGYKFLWQSDLWLKSLHFEQNELKLEMLHYHRSH